METSKKEKGTVNSTQDSVKNQLQDTNSRAFPMHIKRIVAIKTLIPKTTFIIKLYKFQFKIDIRRT